MASAKGQIPTGGQVAGVESSSPQPRRRHNETTACELDLATGLLNCEPDATSATDGRSFFRDREVGGVGDVLQRALDLRRMPRACPVKSHVRCYSARRLTRPDATGLPRGGSRCPLSASESVNATNPPGKPVAFGQLFIGLCVVAANANVHGASPWH
jgi:hypothetical protein